MSGARSTWALAGTGTHARAHFLSRLGLHVLLAAAAHRCMRRCACRYATPSRICAMKPLTCASVNAMELQGARASGAGRRTGGSVGGVGRVGGSVRRATRACQAAHGACRRLGRRQRPPLSQLAPILDDGGQIRRAQVQHQVHAVAVHERVPKLQRWPGGGARLSSVTTPDRCQRTRRQAPRPVRRSPPLLGRAHTRARVRVTYAPPGCWGGRAPAAPAAP